MRLQNKTFTLKKCPDLNNKLYGHPSYSPLLRMLPIKRQTRRNTRPWGEAGGGAKGGCRGGFVGHRLAHCFLHSIPLNPVLPLAHQKFLWQRILYWMCSINTCMRYLTYFHICWHLWLYICNQSYWSVHLTFIGFFFFFKFSTSFLFKSPVATTKYLTQLTTRHGASNFPAHLIWKPAKIGERPYKYVKQEVQITVK